MTSDQQTQPHIPNEHPSATAYQQRQRQLPHRRLSTSACRSIASVFSTQADQVDAIELKQYTKKLPQTHNYHGGHDEDLQGGQETQDSCSHESGNTDTGVTTPELEEFPKEVSQAPRTVTSTGSPAGHLPSRLSTFWGKNISIIVPSKDARDHLGRQLYCWLLVVFLPTLLLLRYSLNWTLAPSFSISFYNAVYVFIFSCFSGYS